MRLIKRIEVNYLRSIYSANLDQIGDLNLFFGRNDSGKSNILRALNLFFNEESDPRSEFDFDIDMSDLRKKKAAEAKGRQFVSVKLTFNVPPNYQNSLGEEISVKKQWNRAHEINFTSFPSFSGGRAGRLSRFLNEIDFTYIPAIKDLSVYADLIERMYSSAAENSQMLNATSTFIDAIGIQTEALTSQLQGIFGGVTKLSPPTDMATLFRNLDFSHGEEGHSLFKQKGDGIKARHLPELLRFINENEPRKKFFLWGFEEPENSLDLSAATEEAKRFSEFAKRADTQVFITSHSSAFYLAPSTPPVSTKRFFVDKQKLGENGDVTPTRATAKIDDIDTADRMMTAAGLMELPFVIRKLKENDDIRSELERNLKSLQDKLSDLTKPTIFMEGTHDLKSLPALLSKFDFKTVVDIKKLDGTPSNTAALLSAIGKEGGLKSSAKTLFIFDNDKSGRSAMRNLVGANADYSGETCTMISENIAATTLPFQRKSFTDFMSECSLSNQSIKFPFELMLATEELAKLIDKKVPKKGYWRTSIHEEYYQKGQKIFVSMQRYEEGSLGWLYARMVPPELKAEYLRTAISQINVQDELILGFVDKINQALTT